MLMTSDTGSGTCVWRLIEWGVVCWHYPSDIAGNGPLVVLQESFVTRLRERLAFLILTCSRHCIIRGVRCGAALWESCGNSHNSWGKKITWLHYYVHTICHYYSVWFEAVTVILLKFWVFWDVTSSGDCYIIAVVSEDCIAVVFRVGIQERIWKWRQYYQKTN